MDLIEEEDLREMRVAYNAASQVQSIEEEVRIQKSARRRRSYQVDQHIQQGISHLNDASDGAANVLPAVVDRVESLQCDMQQVGPSQSSHQGGLTSHGKPSQSPHFETRRDDPTQTHGGRSAAVQVDADMCAAFAAHMAKASQHPPSSACKKQQTPKGTQRRRSAVGSVRRVGNESRFGMDLTPARETRHISSMRLPRNRSPSNASATPRTPAEQKQFLASIPAPSPLESRRRARVPSTLAQQTETVDERIYAAGKFQSQMFNTAVFTVEKFEVEDGKMKCICTDVDPLQLIAPSSGKVLLVCSQSMELIDFLQSQSHARKILVTQPWLILPEIVLELPVVICLGAVDAYRRGLDL